MLRRFSALILLALYVSMLVLASFHVHSARQTVIDDCEQCMNHETHGGHLSATDGGQHVCLLCQFLSLTHSAVAIAIVFFVQYKTALRRQTPPASLRFTDRGTISLRAPPYSFT